MATREEDAARRGELEQQALGQPEDSANLAADNIHSSQLFSTGFVEVERFRLVAGGIERPVNSAAAEVAEDLGDVRAQRPEQTLRVTRRIGVSLGHDASGRVYAIPRRNVRERRARRPVSIRARRPSHFESFSGRYFFLSP